MVGKAARKLIENIPRPFRRIRTAHDDKAKHMLALMSRPQYRRDHGTVLVQGLKTIQELRKQNVEVQTVIATAKTELQDIEVETHDPAKKILRNPDLIPAKNYYVTDVNLTRRILGTSSRPNAHEIYAEVKVPRMKEST
ncbi:hypothetical protein BDF20DRAFT_827093, partial [Mycotypha africana]|uniref:uncharacterized protein n=1 Tax=Mycotypha africana TaxID=64632 RepID=UPI00230048BC